MSVVLGYDLDREREQRLLGLFNDTDDGICGLLIYAWDAEILFSKSRQQWSSLPGSTSLG